MAWVVTPLNFSRVFAANHLAIRSSQGSFCLRASASSAADWITEGSSKCHLSPFLYRAVASAHSGPRFFASNLRSTRVNLIGQNRRAPLSSLRYSLLLVVPANTH